MRYHFKIYPEKRGFWAQCLELKGCQTQGETLEELHANMQEALNGYLSEDVFSSLIFPKPQKVKLRKNVVAVEVEPSVWMALIIRELRLKNKLTQKNMVEKLNLKYLSNYQRLEDPHRANPELKTLVKIKKIFPEFSIDQWMK